MLRLVIEGTDAEVYQNEPVNLTYQFTDVSEINASRSNYSKSFRLPMTKVNQSIFGTVQELSVVTTFNPKLKLSASLFNDALLLSNGYVQVKAFVKSKGKFMDVECVFFGEVADLSKKVGNALLSDLDLSAYDVPMTIATVEAIWGFATSPTRFGVVDRGHNWSGSETFNAGNYLDVSGPTGFLNVPNLVTTIFSEAGLTYESTFLSSTEIQQLYLMANAGDRNNGFTNAQQNIPFNVGLNSNLVSIGTSWQTLSFSETGAYFDPSSSVSGGVFTVPTGGNYTFRARVSFHTITSSDNIEVKLWKNGAEWLTVVAGNGLNTTESYETTTPSTALSTGDTVEVKFRFINSGDSAIFRGTGNLLNPTTSFELIGVSLAGTSYDAGLNVPIMKQIDFLYGLQRMFNLVFIPDRNVPTKFYIEPMAEYIATGTKKDWTNKLDTSKDVRTTTTADLQARQYDWNMTAGKDFIGQQVLSQLDRVYGRYRVTDPQNDFATGTKEITSPFASYTISNIPDTDFQILRNIGAAGEVLENPAPRLAFWTGMQSVGNWYFGNGTNLRTTFPVFSDISDFGTSVAPDTIDLNYGYEPKFRQITANPRDALYYKYYHPFTGSLYSADARIMTAFFTLTPAEIAQFEWSDQIYIQDTYWRILSIEYVANDSGATAKVSLLKVVGADRLCTYIPVSFDKEGRIKFTSPTGTELYTVSRRCCELFGGRYDENTSYCWGQNQLS